MNATCFGLRDSAVDAVVCVEAAFHFRTRNDFLSEVWRILKPGGRLLLSDILFRSEQWAGAWTVPRENRLPDIATYRRALIEAGFDCVVVDDATEACWNGFCRNLASWIDKQDASSEIHEDERQMWRQVIRSLANEGVAQYLIVTARKPVSTATKMHKMHK
jgi:SAM-dependent methyltransferase